MDTVNLIKKHEDLRLLPYTDTTGHLTIGYGCNLTAGITPEQAQALLNLKVVSLERQLMNYDWFFTCNEPRKAVLIDMAFNLGMEGLLGFRIMLDCINRGDWPGAASQMANSEWARQVGGRAVEDAKIMAEGVFTDGSGANSASNQS